MISVPAGWTLKTLGDVATWGSGGTPKAGTAAYYGGNIPWAVIGDLTDGPVHSTASTITPAGLLHSSAKIVGPDAVLIAMYGSMGRLGLPTVEMATNQAIAFAIPKPGLSRLFLFYYLMSVRDELAAAGRGTTQTNLSQKLLKQWPIAVAPLPEQERIVAAIEGHFSRMDAGMALVLRVRANLEHRLRPAVLSAAFAGQLVPERE